MSSTGLLRAVVRRWWGAIAAAAAAVLAVLGQAQDVYDVGVRVVGMVSQVWERWGPAQFGVVLGILAVTVGLLVLIWWREIAPTVARMWRQSRARLAAKLAGSAVLVTGVAVLVAVLLLYDTSPDDLVRLMADAKAVNALAVRTYNTNGSADYEMRSESGIGPGHFARITLTLFGGTADENCGWMLIFRRGADLTRFDQIRFMVRGTQSKEHFGIRAKDAYGKEVGFSVGDERFIEGSGKITKTWQVVTVPFRQFASVDFGLFDNFSLYVTGTMAGPGPQTIDVGGFELRRAEP